MDDIESVIKLLDSQGKKERKNLLFKYLKKWPWFVLFGMIGVLLGYYYFINSPNIYQVESRILIVNENNKLSSDYTFDDPMQSLDRNKNIANKIGILQSYTLFQKTVDKLDWNTSWSLKKTLYNADLYHNPPFKLIVPPNAINVEDIDIEIEVVNDNEYKILVLGKTSRNGYSQLIEIEQNVKYGTPFFNDFFNFTLENINGVKDKTYILRFKSLHALTSYYLRNTEIELVHPEADFISISIEGEIVQKETDFINELNNTFIEFGLMNKNQNSDNSLQFIDSQLSRIKGTLDSAGISISSYRKRNKAINLGQEAQLVYRRLEEIENEQYLTQLQIDYYIDLQQYIDNDKSIEDIVNPSIVGISDENLNGTLSKLKELYSRREALSYSVQDKNPTLVLIDKEIRITRNGLEESLNNQLNATKLKKESLQKRYNEIQSRLNKLPDTEKQLIGIQRKFDLNNELYTYMLQKRAETSLSKASIASEIQIIDKALAESAVHVGPNLIMDLAAGLIGGGILPFIFITLLSFFNNKIGTIEEVEKRSKIPVFEGIVKHKYKVKLPVIHHPRSGLAESFRGVKSNINAFLRQTDSKVISVNSLLPNEGKSFVSSNLAAIISKTNKKVLLIEADMHNPKLCDLLDFEESDGLSNYFSNEKKTDEIIFNTSIPNLHIIPAGPVSTNPSDLMGGSEFEKLIDKVRSNYDYIIIDNAPLLLVPDTILTSGFSDISLFILRINLSHRDEIFQINKIVDFNRIKRAAVVVNGASDRGYSYGKKYWKKGYGEYIKN